jgi:hypothetical protein
MLKNSRIKEARNMNDKFTADLRDRLSEFVNNVSYETLSEAFTKANFNGYRHLKGSFFGLAGGVFDDISIERGRTISFAIGQAYELLEASFTAKAVEMTPIAADHQDLALAA